MKELSRLAKFFIICAAVFFVGMVCTIAGVAAGGVQNIEKLADNYDWIQGNPGERGVTAQKVEDYDSIEATGDADLYIVGKEFYKNASWLANQDVLEQTELDVIGKNKVIVIAGDKMEQPKITVENGVLKIDSGKYEFNGINLNMSDVSYCPTILICAPMEELQSLKVSGQTADIEILGVSWKDANIGVNTGDIEMEGVTSGGLSAGTDSGDIEIQGELLKTTVATTDFGDIEIDTPLAKAEYALELDTEGGDISVKEGSEEAVEYEADWDGVKEKGGPHKIIAKANSGDIEVHFGN